MGQESFSILSLHATVEEAEFNSDTTNAELVNLSLPSPIFSH